MSLVTLELKFAGAARRETCAWLVPCDDVREWVRVLAELRCDPDVPLMVVPTSERDRQPLGLLIGEAEADAHARQQPVMRPPRCLPYGRVAEKLYLPVDATITPPVIPDEWEQLLNAEMAAYVWHPTAGLIGCESHQVLSAVDLLKPARLVRDRWSMARPGTHINHRLLSISYIEPPSAEEIMRQAADGIGTQSHELKTLNPTLGGSAAKMLNSMRETLGNLLRRMRGRRDQGDGDSSQSPRQRPGKPVPQGGTPGGSFAAFGRTLSQIAAFLPQSLLLPFAYAAHRFARNAPQTASQPTWVNQLESWSQNLLQNAANLFNARNRSVEKLLEMLAKRPDEGLKYAIPMGGEGQPGPGSGSSQLMPRNIDFNLSSLFGGGGGFADMWDLSPDLTMQLHNRYRELAQREIQLKRYRRAAYIYATLLNDLPLAARTLCDGGIYGDAAILYRDKLNNPHEAARCFERAGRFPEAIKLYESLEDFEKIGELHERLDEREAAEAAYRTASEVALKKSDRIEAARILEQRLSVPQEALSVLQAGWPDSAQAVRCLNESFALMSRLGIHDEANEYVSELRNAINFQGNGVQLVECFARHAATYPAEHVRSHMVDAARVVTSRAVLEQHRSHKDCVASLSRIAPQDRLLDRDCQRFVEQLRRQAKKPKAQRTTSRGKNISTTTPTLVRGIPLPPGVSWQNACAVSHGFVAVGDSSRALQLVRVAWEGDQSHLQSVTWNSRVLTDAPVLLAVDQNRTPEIAVMPIGGPPLTTRTIPSTNVFPAWTAETPGWLADDSLGIAQKRVPPETWMFRSDGSVASINLEGRFSHDESLVEKLVQLEVFANEAHAPIPMLIRRETLSFGIGVNLLNLRAGSNHLELIEFDRPIYRLAAATEHTLPRFAVMYDEGGCVYWPNKTDNHTRTLSKELEQPHALFLRDGRLVVRTQERWQIYGTTGGTLVMELDAVEHSRTPPVAMFPGDKSNRIAVCYQDGPLLVYEIE